MRIHITWIGTVPYTCHHHHPHRTIRPHCIHRQQPPRLPLCTQHWIKHHLTNLIQITRHPVKVPFFLATIKHPTGCKSTAMKSNSLYWCQCNTTFAITNGIKSTKIANTNNRNIRRLITSRMQMQRDQSIPKYFHLVSTKSHHFSIWWIQFTNRSSFMMSQFSSIILIK